MQQKYNIKRENLSLSVSHQFFSFLHVRSFTIASFLRLTLDRVDRASLN